MISISLREHGAWRRFDLSFRQHGVPYYPMGSNPMTKQAASGIRTRDVDLASRHVTTTP